MKAAKRERLEGYRSYKGEEVKEAKACLGCIIFLGICCVLVLVAILVGSESLRNGLEYIRNILF